MKTEVGVTHVHTYLPTELPKYIHTNTNAYLDTQRKSLELKHVKSAWLE